MGGRALERQCRREILRDRDFLYGLAMPAWLNDPWIKAAGILLGSLVAALLIELLFRKVITRLVRLTKSTVDDEIARSIRQPIYLSTIIACIAWALRVAPMHATVVRIADATLWTIAIVLWSITLARVSSLVFSAIAQRSGSDSFVRVSTQPIFEIFSKLGLFGASSYAIMLAWNINVGAWLASAGIAGIALGFAAKDSLSNLFAGIFIVADSPYKVGDFIELDGDLRGSVTSIGFRSTRLLTLDDIEIIVPNSVLGNAQIVNESGGPFRRARVAVVVECAYGSDVDLVREVMLKCADGAQFVSDEPRPLVRFASFGGSGLVHQLLVWIERPRYRELVTDDLNRRIYKAFMEAGIEIPYSKHDIYIKQIVGLPKGVLK